MKTAKDEKEEIVNSLVLHNQLGNVIDAKIRKTTIFFMAFSNMKSEITNASKIWPLVEDEYLSIKFNFSLKKRAK